MPRPGTSTTEWRLSPPESWCPVEAKRAAVENAVGRFERRVARTESGALLVKRETRLDLSWVEGEEMADLEKLALAEHRASRRMVRLRCAEAAPAGAR